MARAAHQAEQLKCSTSRSSPRSSNRSSCHNNSRHSLHSFPRPCLSVGGNGAEKLLWLGEHFETRMCDSTVSHTEIASAILKWSKLDLPEQQESSRQREEGGGVLVEGGVEVQCRNNRSIVSLRIALCPQRPKTNNAISYGLTHLGPSVAFPTPKLH